ncbi:conserved hypothetical protein [Ricinus communis]|uniref:Subtilisin-like protease fibronectin type-III domain-containing protein n=1 Tax=Ricinus communis TaxID=3988 RepID=B9SGA0_RICCO|nr:conserved hypothetical protein [Ricinus communis]
MSNFVDKSYNCPSAKISLLDFNYPSSTVPNLSENATLTRTLKNVGTPGVYTVRIRARKGISIKIVPTRLKFSKVHEEKSFKHSMVSRGAQCKEPNSSEKSNN